MVTQVQIADRYEILEPLGEGGMGVVYRALDLKTKSYVALKTMRDVSQPEAVDLFTKEWGILASISHPNIIDIRDVGEIQENGQRKPFFVMPLLSGETLGALIATASPRLTVERVVDILCQVCRGLQAAHERGLIHRDIKPSNIFVMEDDAVKIIDFGIAHLAGSNSATGLKGTWQYMAPEQIDLRPATPVSDLFSLAVVCYEALTTRKPFARQSSVETAEAVRHYTPPPISEINPAVSHLVSMVIHKAMAKQPMHRFASAREFAEVLQKAQANQPLERFDRSRIQPRIERAKRAFSEGDTVFSSEILTELEAEGHIDKEITLLRVQIEQASRRKKVRQLIEGAKARMEQDEIPLALEKLQEVLEIDPDNADALALRAVIEKQRNERQIENWMSLARRHMEQHDFAKARQALEEVLKMRPSLAEALELDAENDRREQESLRIRAEKEQLYGSAVNAYQNGEISSALTKLERILELGRETPDAAVPERDAIYQGFYNQVRSERDAIHNGYEECRRHFSDKNFTRALELCDEFLAKYPGDALFQALKLEAVEQQRQDLSAYIAEIGKRIDAEADLDRKVNILKEACERHPNEQQFQQLLKLTRERRDLVLSIVAKARQYEEKAQFAEAIGQWDILRNIYPRYPGIDFEVGQLRRRREQQTKDEGKAKLVEQIDRALECGDFARARDLAANALADYTQDQELTALERLASQGLERSSEARKLYSDAQALHEEGRSQDATECLRRASELSPKDPLVRDALVQTLVEQGRGLLETDWRKAESLAQEAAALDGSHTEVRQLRSLLADSKRKDFVAQCLAEARELQAAGNLEAAIEKVEQGLALYPNEVRLAQLQATLQNSLQDLRLRQERNQDVESLKNLLRQVEHQPAAQEMAPILQQSQAILHKHPDDPEIGSVAAEIQQWAVLTERHSPEVPEPPPTPDIPNRDRQESAPASVPSGYHNSIQMAVRKFWAYLTEPVAQNRGVPLSHIAIVTGMIVIAAAGIIYSSLPKRPPKQAPKPAIARMSVRIHAMPADATVKVNGEVRTGTLDLDPNATYKISVSRLGYRSLEQQGVRPAQDWNFTLEPEMVHLNILTAEKAGTVLIDGKEVGMLEGVPDLEWAPDAAEHILSVTGRNGELFTFSFKAEPGTRPRPGPLKVKDLIVVSSLGSEATVYSGSPEIRATLPGQDPQPLQADGLNLTGLGPDNHELAFDRKDLPKIPIELGNAPALYVVLNSDPNVGSLYITANIENARLSIDGREVKPSKKGGWWIERRPGMYAVKLSAEGYEDFQDQVEFARGALTKRKVELRARPKVASLIIQGGTPGSEVWLDGARLTTLDGFGLAKQDGIAPGPHRITFRKEFFEPAPAIVRVFAAGQSITLGASESKLKEFGTLSFQVTPADAQVSYRRADQQESHTARAGDSVRVPEGRYIVSAQSDGYAAKTVGDVSASSGKIASVDLKLARIAKKPEPVEAPSPTGLFENASRMEQVGEWWRGKGSGYVFLKPGVQKVTITFSNPGKGLFGRSKKVEWVAHYVSDKEKVLYELDATKLMRRATVSGADSKPARTPHHLSGDADAYTISVAVEPGRIVISAAGQTLDTYEGQDLASGMIGIKANTLFTVGK